MTPEESGDIIHMLKATWTRKAMRDDTAEIYVMCLRDLDYQDAKAAVLDLIANSKWMPSIAEIRQATLALTDDMPSAADAWGEVNEAFHYPGVWGDPQWSDPIVGKVVAGMGGWKVLCVSENGMADRAHFLKAYRIEAERVRYDRVRLPEARQLEGKARARIATATTLCTAYLWVHMSCRRGVRKVLSLLLLSTIYPRACPAQRGIRTTWQTRPGCRSIPAP